MMDFDDKPFHNVAKDEIKLASDDKEKKVLKKTKEVYKPLTKWWRELLGKKSGVEAVKVSSRLSSTPCVVVASKFAPLHFHLVLLLLECSLNVYRVSQSMQRFCERIMFILYDASVSGLQAVTRGSVQTTTKPHAEI